MCLHGKGRLSGVGDARSKATMTLTFHPRGIKRRRLHAYQAAPNTKQCRDVAVLNRAVLGRREKPQRAGKTRYLGKVRPLSSIFE